MERNTLVRLRAAFGLAYTLDSIERSKLRIFIQLSTFEDQHTGSRPKELASDCQAGRTAADYNEVCVNYGIGTESAKIFDFQASFSNDGSSNVNTGETPEQVCKMRGMEQTHRNAKVLPLLSLQIIPASVCIPASVDQSSSEIYRSGCLQSTAPVDIAFRADTLDEIGKESFSQPNEKRTQTTYCLY